MGGFHVDWWSLHQNNQKSAEISMEFSSFVICRWQMFYLHSIYQCDGLSELTGLLQGRIYIYTCTFIHAIPRYCWWKQFCTSWCGKPLFTWCHTSQVVQDFFHQQYCWLQGFRTTRCTVSGTMCLCGVSIFWQPCLTGNTTLLLMY